MSWMVYNEDGTERLEWLIRSLIQNGRTPVIVSDPPFNIGYHYATYSDQMPESEYLDLMAEVFGMCPSVLIHYPESIYKIAIKMGQAPERVVSWVYNSNTGRQHRDIAFFGVRPDFRKVTQPYKNPNDKRIRELIAKGRTGSKLYDWWNVNQVKNVSKDKTAHPCQMPVEVMANIAGILPDDITIIDPFMGSGTTGVGAIMHGKDFIGFDIDRDYCDIARERLDRAEREYVEIQRRAGSREDQGHEGVY